jgi:hypothetical protein
VKTANIIQKLRAQVEALKKSDSTSAQAAAAELSTTLDELEVASKELANPDVMNMTVEGYTALVAEEQKLAASEDAAVARKRLAHLAEQGVLFQKALLDAVTANSWTKDTTFQVLRFKASAPSVLVSELERTLLEHDIEPGVAKSILQGMGLGAILTKNHEDIVWPEDINEGNEPRHAALRQLKKGEKISFGSDGACEPSA